MNLTMLRLYLPSITKQPISRTSEQQPKRPVG